MRRFLGLSIAAVAVAVVVGVPVATAGGKPVVTQVRFEGEDAEASASLSEFCGFDVVVFVDVRATERDYPDGSERDTVNEGSHTPPVISSSSSTTPSSLLRRGPGNRALHRRAVPDRG